MTVKVFAPAKINLCLHVVGQREDGLHLLDSLVCFADIGDQLQVDNADQTGFSMSGLGVEILPDDATNLVLQAAALYPKSYTTHIHLTKDLPIAAGLGGGSADAAATLRAMSQLWSQPLPAPGAQLDLGADIPVCVHGRPVRMRGIGEILDPFPTLPPLFVVLVNSGTPVPTGAVFAALTQKNNPPLPDVPDSFDDTAGFAQWIKAQRNDLQVAACSVTGDITRVLAALDRTNPVLSRMSGSGGTCFALFDTAAGATACAQAVQTDHPDWWVRSGAILD